MAMGVTVDFNANLVKFSGQVDRMAGQLDKFQVHAETMSSRVNRSLGALGVGVSIAGLAAFAKSGIDAADALSKMADRTGISVEKLSGWELAVDLADANIEDFINSSNKLSIYIAKNSEEMKKLGISAKDPSEAMLQFADVFSKIEDPQRRAAFGNAVLGRSYANLAPLLMSGVDALREQIEIGHEMTGITTEQAKASADFNDRLTELSKSVTSLAVKSIQPALPYLTSFTNGLILAAREAKGFSAAVDGNFWGHITHGLLGFDQEAETKKMEKMVADREAAFAKLGRPHADQPSSVVPAAAVNEAALAAVIKANGEAGQSTEQLRKAEESRRDGILKTINDLKAEISVSGESVEQQKMLLEIHNATAKATGSESEQIRKLIEAKYDLADSDAILAEGEKLALKQRTDMESEYDRLNQKFNGNLLDLNKGISDAMDARAQGIIPNDVELKNVLDKMGQDYNALTDNAKTSTDQMSEYAIQGARSMQSAFSDFLFDPFKDGADGMAANFLNVVRRMAADAASAKIMEGLLGKTGVADGGGLLGSLFSSVADLFSGGGFNGSGPLLSFANAHTGGVIGQTTGRTLTDPLVFNGAMHYHTGGVAGLKPNEVPAVLLRGEEVLTTNDPRHRYNQTSRSSGDISITTQISVTGANDASSNNMQELGGMINARIKEVIVAEKRPGGLLA